MSTLDKIDFEHMHARELLRAVDRSDPQVKALAACLEKHVEFVDSIKSKLASEEVSDARD